MIWCGWPISFLHVCTRRSHGQHQAKFWNLKVQPEKYAMNRYECVWVKIWNPETIRDQWFCFFKPILTHFGNQILTNPPWPPLRSNGKKWSGNTSKHVDKASGSKGTCFKLVKFMPFVNELLDEHFWLKVWSVLLVLYASVHVFLCVMRELLLFLSLFFCVTAGPFQSVLLIRLQQKHWCAVFDFHQRHCCILLCSLRLCTQKRRTLFYMRTTMANSYLQQFQQTCITPCLPNEWPMVGCGDQTYYITYCTYLYVLLLFNALIRCQSLCWWFSEVQISGGRIGPSRSQHVVVDLQKETGNKTSAVCSANARGWVSKGK